jgi:arylsulfatase A-like enzyme
MKFTLKKTVLATLVASTLLASQAMAADKPNIVVIMGDDVGESNISAFTHGLMGYKTPNIDRIAKEGALFTDYYGQQSSTAGRSAFITGQSPVRTGLTKVGLPGAKEGLSEKDPTLAQILKGQGYATGQFGKNHLGDRNEHLPTVHGFDEFFGNLYHLNAEEEPENADYPKNADFKNKFGPRGVLKCTAGGSTKDDSRFGAFGKQSCVDTGPLTKKRMETVDDEFVGASLDFMDRQAKSGKPFFAWINSSRIHINTHLKAESVGKTGLGLIADAMVEHDAHVGQILDKIEALGLKENTIVIYTTDNGAELMAWPDAGMTKFRGEKNTNWEGGYRVPAVMRWPGKVAPGTVFNDITSAEDWFPTLAAAAGAGDVKSTLLKGQGGFKVHLDGFNLVDAFGGKAEWPRKDFFYWTDDGDLAALRYGRFKVNFLEQRTFGFNVWAEPLVPLRLPKLFDLRADPYERASRDGWGFDKWRVDHAYVLVPAAAHVGEFLASFKEFPMRQKPGSFSIGDAMEKLKASSSN